MIRNVLALQIALVTANRAAQVPAEGCPRPAPSPQPAIVTIAEPRETPCRIEFRDVGVTLRPDAAGSVAQVGQYLARDSRGQMYTYTGLGEVSVWSPTGQFIRNFGRQGQGPGELRNGPLTLTTDASDNLYVRDNNLRWSVFGPDHRFLRSFSAAGVASATGFIQMVAPGQMLTSEATGGTSQFFFNVYDMRGAAGAGGTPPIARSFAQVPAAEAQLDRSEKRRMITPVAGAGFWAGPPEAAGRGFELEQWSTDGRLIRTVRRDAPWYRKGDDSQPPRGQGAARPRPPTALVTLHADTSGLVYVAVRRTNDGWSRVANLPPDYPRAARDSLMAGAFDIHIEVIDTRAGVVLAREGPLPVDRARRDLPVAFFGTGWTGYGLAETPDGERHLVLRQMRLSRR